MAHVRDEIDVQIIQSREIMKKRRRKVVMVSTVVGIGTLVLGTALMFRKKSISCSPSASLLVASAVVSASMITFSATDYILDRKVQRQHENTIVQGEFRANAMAADYLIANGDGLSAFIFYCHLLIRVDNHKILKENCSFT